MGGKGGTTIQYTMDSANTSDKPDASAATDDSHSHGIDIKSYLWSYCYLSLLQPEELPSKLRQGR